MEIGKPLRYEIHRTPHQDTFWAAREKVHHKTWDTVLVQVRFRVRDVIGQLIFDHEHG